MLKTSIKGLLFAAVSTLSIGQAFADEMADMTNADKAVAVLQSIQSGDVSALETYVNQDTYIQHNPGFPDGIAPLMGAVSSGAFEGTLVSSYRTISDGDFAVVQSLYSGAWNGKSPQVAIDVFRFEDDLIVEHWDNIMPLASSPNPSGNTQLDGVTAHTDLDATDANRAMARDYIDTVLVNGNIDQIGEFVEGDNYIQHHPDIANGVSGLTAALGHFAEQAIVMEYDEIHQVHAEGNFAIVMSEGSFGGEPYAFFDLMGLSNGHINQHWGIMAPIPPQSEWNNANGKF